MDPRHPNIAFGANTAALVASICLLFSAFLPYGTPRGWGIPETILVCLIPVLIGISWWAKRDHVVPVVHAHGTSEAQYEAMEELPTMVSLDNVNQEANTNTIAVIESIIGAQQTQDSSTISDALGALSSGSSEKSPLVDDIQNNMPKSVRIEDKFDERGFQTDGLASVPLPNNAPLEAPKVPVVTNLSEMPDLEDLLNEDEYSAAPPPLDLPELPDL